MATGLRHCHDGCAFHLYVNFGVREVSGLAIEISGKFDAVFELGKQCLDSTWMVIRG